MNYKYLLASLLLVLIGCDQPSSLSFENIHLDLKSDPDCAVSPCPIIDLDYPIALGEDAVSIAISDGLEQRIISSFRLNPDIPVASTVEQCMQQFKENYRSDLAEFPDMSGQYELGITLAESFRNKKLICFRHEDYKYTGGAHGNAVTLYQFFDLKAGNELEFDQLISDHKGLEQLAEKRFRDQFEIGETESINAPGFWFENEIFVLPETFGLEENQLILVYNTYEIASYADGTIEVNIPLSEAQKFLSL